MDPLNIPSPVPYAEQLKEQNAAQSGMTRAEIRDNLSSTTEYMFDPETAVPVKHVWVDRGLKMSCEGAGHPMHQSWKRQSKY